jgi:cytoskeletal protein CcmA (bactofilin family)
MFGNSSNDQKNKSNGMSGASSTATNSLVQGTNLEGSIQADTDIRIDGTLTGSLNCKGKVIIGPTGYISGEITCENAVIEGRFEGILIVGDVLHIKETAKVEGDVSTNKLVVQPGSIFNVKCKMGAQSGAKKGHGSQEETIELSALGKSKAAMS